MLGAQGCGIVGQCGQIPGHHCYVDRTVGGKFGCLGFGGNKRGWSIGDAMFVNWSSLWRA